MCMQGYASRTSNLRNLDALRRAGWRLMVAANDLQRWFMPHERRNRAGFRYAIDNGAWHAYQHGLQFNEIAFASAYERLAMEADFAVLPDIVAGGLQSLEYSLSWRDRLRACPTFLAVQDGMTAAHVAPALDGIAGIFVGGSTEWKERSLPTWGSLARQQRVKLHVGRVNTARRIFLSEAAGATSFDGSSASRYASTLTLLENARQQRELPWELF